MSRSQLLSVQHQSVFCLDVRLGVRKLALLCVRPSSVFPSRYACDSVFDLRPWIPTTPRKREDNQACSSRVINACTPTYSLTLHLFPLSRSGVTYPANGVAECYTRALEERGLTAACFSSSTQQSFNLGGAYRRWVQPSVLLRVLFNRDMLRFGWCVLILY